VSFRPDCLLKVVRAFAAAHLPLQLWVLPRDIAWIGDDSVAPQPIDTLYVDPGYRLAMKLSYPGGWTVAIPKSIRLDCKNGVSHRIVAPLAPDVDPDKAMLGLTDKHEVVILLQTAGANIKPDGMVQIYGGAPGLLVLTPEHIQQRRRRALIYGDNVLSLATEELADDGAWRSAACGATISRSWLAEDGADNLATPRKE
jgi:hypothetical protein